MRHLMILLLAMSIMACQKNTEKATGIVARPKLVKLWATEPILKTPESVIYDQNNQLLYVANVNLNPWKKDGNGFISKLDPDGKVIDLEWVTGLNGPKGMGLSNSSLYVNDIDEIVEINLETGTVADRYKVDDETANLNDITIGNDGTVYASGSGNQTVYKLKNGKIEPIMRGDLGRPNGLLYQNGILYILGSNDQKLKALDLATMKITSLTDSLGHADGIVPVGDGHYLASNWKGQLFHIASSNQTAWKRTLLLDTQNEKINAADIDFIAEKNLLLVPTFFDNRVVAYRLDKD